MARLLVLLADGTEEMEFVITVDMVRRAGLEVVTAGIEKEEVIGSRGLRLRADTVLQEIHRNEFDGLIVPGGSSGVDAMCRSAEVLAAVAEFARREKMLAAICAGPKVLDAAGVLEDRTYTCYPGVEQEIRHGQRVDRKVMCDGSLITSQGPGTAFAFALAIIAYWCGADRAREVAGRALVNVTDECF